MLAAQVDRGQWFKSLMQPDNHISCCDVSDCERTQAEYTDGAWWAIVEKKWRLMPPEKILTHPTSLDGEAYVCHGHGTPTYDAVIYCFVPPTMGS